MQSIKEKVEQNIYLKKYSELINKIAKVEYKNMGMQHLVEFDELVNIGLQTVSLLSSQAKNNEFNDSYLSTAIKWAIRNELRNRYRWYGIKRNETITSLEQEELREAIYHSVLSTDEVCENKKTFEIRDTKKTPEENCAFTMMSNSIKSAVMGLPKRERELIELKFFKEKLF